MRDERPLVALKCGLVALIYGLAALKRHLVALKRPLVALKNGLITLIYGLVTLKNGLTAILSLFPSLRIHWRIYPLPIPALFPSPIFVVKYAPSCGSTFRSVAMKRACLKPGVEYTRSSSHCPPHSTRSMAG